MVVQAIRGDNDRARVNERHDIVLDQGQRLPAGSIPDSRDMYKTAYSLGVNELPSLKVSGSAYKLTRTRSLHHGTCLLNSPNLDLISRCLQSPAKSFIKARGVESVRSPVSNIYSGSEVDAHSRFRAHMLAAFSSLYGLESDFMDAFSVLNENGRLKCGGSWVAGYLTDCLSEIPEIRMGVRELQSSEWVYGQTPQFTLSTHPTEDDERARPSLLSELPASAQVNIKVRSGIITFAEILLATDNHSSTNRELIKDTLKGLHICKIKDFNTLSQKPNEFDNGEGARCLWKWLNKILGKV
ncbi:Biotin/lipoate A/B protein ligase [Varicellaria rhodocarpa]|nr:Biotin/lipoate A/B protein ligase [Varicellaria rhodocarpa]